MRINMFSGPGGGKSTTAAFIFSELKRRKYSIEIVTEYVKSWAYSKKNINEFDQVYLFGKQTEYEYRFISNGVKNTITDSPTLLSCLYSQYYYPQLSFGSHLEAIADEYELKHPSLNIILDRGSKEYVQEGRFQSYAEAKEIDQIIKDRLYSKYQQKQITNLFEIPYNDTELILKTVLEHVES